MGVASILGSYVAKASYEDLPQDVITATKERTLDYLGTAFDTYRKSPKDMVVRVLKTYGGQQESTVIGEGIKLPCAFAAMINSAYNLSDGSRFSGQHLAVCVVPAALAASEARCSTKTVNGRELILAIVLGYEVMLRIGQSMHPSAHIRGFHPTVIHGTFGAAAAVSKILGLDEESTKNAISIAGTMSNGVQAAARAPRPLIDLQTGRAAESGVLSALVAREGLKGSDDILEKGFFPAFSDEYNLDIIEKNLGQDHAVAAALLYDAVPTDRFRDGTVWNEQVQHLMGKTVEEHDPELDKEYPQKRPESVEITTRGGEIFSHRVDLPKGEPENPLPQSEIENKFHYMSEPVINEETRGKIIDFINTLETREDITGLFPLFKANIAA